MTRDDIKKTVERMMSKSKNVIQQLKTIGLPIPQKPESLGNMNIFQEWEQLKKQYGGVGNVPHKELGEFLDKWNSLISYARWLEAVADAKQANSREIRDTIKKQLYTLQEGSRETKDALVHTDPLYLQWEEQYIEDLTYYITLKALRESYEYRATSISREITRRGDDVENTQRVINVLNQRGD